MDASCLRLAECTPVTHGASGVSFHGDTLFGCGLAWIKQADFLFAPQIVILSWELKITIVSM